MGKLTLLIVAAAILGGATLKLGMNLIAGDTVLGRSEAEADVLARQIAETGQSLVLATMVGEEGFVDPGLTGCPNPGTTGCAYDGGRFTVSSVRSADNQQVTVTVEGRFGGAVHTVQSTYAFDPMEYPGPIWLDVPYATAAAAPAARVSGTVTDHPVRFDIRPFQDQGLGRYLSEATMRTNLAAVVTATGSALSVPVVGDWAPTGALLEDLSRQNDIGGGEDLYQAAVSAIDRTDQVFATAKTVTGTETWGGPTRITRVRGDLTVTGRLTGSGALLVDGALRVTGRMTWNGLVIVRSQSQLLPVALDGDADITGGLLVVQQAFPPGGHMDVTVNRRFSGMTGPVGERPGPNWPLAAPMDYTWYEHTHKFDQTPETAPRGRRIVFADNGAGPHEGQTRFWESIAAAGSEPVRLEFKHPENHGFSRYSMALRSQPDSLIGSVRTGFGDFAEPEAPFRSQVFPASDLRTLIVNVQSLRALKDRFDGAGGCGYDWPLCIGQDWDRASTFSLRLVRERDNAVLYDASVYWHMRTEEVTAHQAEEQAWLASLTSGTSFGTHLTMGSQASVRFQLRDIVRLAEKIGFDGNEVRLLSSVSEHVSAAEMRARQTVTLCHVARGTNIRTTVTVPQTELQSHLAHGDAVGACAGTATGAATGTGSNSNSGFNSGSGNGSSGG